MPNNADSSSQILPAFHEQDIGNNRETYDSGNLSEVNLAYNNITFHVYPVLKITNERSGGRGVLPRENDSDFHNFVQE
jgi:hypothetical protein